MKTAYAAAAAVAALPLASAAGLYSGKSAVLQVDAKSFPKLIEKSNYTSIVEFYAPWCGHCKNLQPAYEKVASSLAGYAKVAAVNCDDDANKPFCGSMGVQGFPTLKIVKPKIKGGKPVISDYRGERTAEAIKDALIDKILNHVTKVTDDQLDSWLQGDKPKLVFFSDKPAVSLLVKAIAIDFLGPVDVAYITSKEKAAKEKFSVLEYPQIYYLATPSHVPEQYKGEIKKDALIQWLSSQGVEANPEFPKGKEPKQTKLGKPTPVAKPAKEEKAPKEKTETAKESTPSPVEKEPAPALPTLADELALEISCLMPKSATCILALGQDADTLSTLAELRHKQTQRSSGAPVYAVDVDVGNNLLASLGVAGDAAKETTVLAINTKRRWFTVAPARAGPKDLEHWFDSIRLGDFAKQALPEDVVQTARKGVAEAIADAEALAETQGEAAAGPQPGPQVVPEPPAPEDPNEMPEGLLEEILKRQAEYEQEQAGSKGAAAREEL